MTRSAPSTGEALTSLQQMVNAIEQNGVRIESPNIGGGDPEIGDESHYWHEEWLHYAKKALAARTAWRPVVDELPDFGRIIIVTYPSNYDGKPIYAWGTRADASEGWVWVIKSYGGSDIRPDETAGWNEFESDDDYQVTHWMPLPEPPEPAP